MAVQFPRPPFALLVDVTRCTGCERCVEACGQVNGIDPNLADRDGAVSADGLSSNRLCTIVRTDDGRFMRKSCMHCLEPSCVAACLVGGLAKSPEGPVVYDADACIGCRYCMLACPAHIPRYEWNATFPFMKKCTMCRDRLLSGLVPACVEACTHEALEFGSRETMLALARQRILESPELYLDHVWGETDWGGASVLYISDVDLAPLGLGDPPVASVPSITDPVIHTTPWVAGSVAVTMTGLSWIVRRRQRLMAGGADSGSEG
jgi:formate dehydrogenase iron-sulfur subunit